MAEDLAVMARMFDVLDWLVPRTEAFPRAHRHGVTLRLVNAALDCQEALFAAQASRGPARAQALARADAALNNVRLLLRLAQRWKWLTEGQYEHASRLVAEVGRLLGGWLKQTATASGSQR